MLSGGVDTICIHCNDLHENDYRELENFLERHIQQVLPFSEILEQLWYPGRTIKIRLQERQNLLRHRVRKFTAESPILQAYLQETWDADPSRKRKKRLFGLWRLIRLRRAGKRKTNQKKR